MLQNALLALIVLYLARSALLTGERWLRAAFGLLAFLFIFVLLEEIDYGLHYYDYFTGSMVESSAGEWNRNLHNRSTAAGVQWGSYMKLVSKAMLVLGFVVAPLVMHRSENRLARLLTPSRWAAATVLLMFVLSRLAHVLDRAGLSLIDGTAGGLEHNISEFREFNLYYLFLLYFAELFSKLKKAGFIRKTQHSSD